MTASTYLRILESIESLYAAVVTDPAGWGEQAFADWANDTLTGAGELPRNAVREIRRSLRAAQKLQAFWAADSSAVPAPDDWQSRVDIALGPRAWRPLLDLARVGLDNAASEELFEEVRARFAVVNSERWMEGISFEEWSRNN